MSVNEITTLGAAQDRIDELESLLRDVTSERDRLRQAPEELKAAVANLVTAAGVANLIERPVPIESDIALLGRAIDRAGERAKGHSNFCKYIGERLREGLKVAGVASDDGLSPAEYVSLADSALRRVGEFKAVAERDARTAEQKANFHAQVADAREQELLTVYEVLGREHVAGLYARFGIPDPTQGTPDEEDEDAERMGAGGTD